MTFAHLLVAMERVTRRLPEHLRPRAVRQGVESRRRLKACLRGMVRAGPDADGRPAGVE